MFVERLKQLRASKRVTQEALARTFSVAQSTVGMWESGKREPDFETLQSLADYFGVTTDYLLGKSDTPNPQQQKKPTPIEGLAADISNMLVERGIVGEGEELTADQKNHLLFCFDVATDLFKKLKEQG